MRGILVSLYISKALNIFDNITFVQSVIYVDMLRRVLTFYGFCALIEYCAIAL